MSRARRVCWTALAVSLAGLYAVYHVLFNVGRVPDASDFAIDIAEIRRLATSLEGELPDRVRSLVLGRFSIPRVTAIAGAGWGAEGNVSVSFQVISPQRTAIIETGLGHVPESERLGVSDSEFYPDRMQELRAALLAADLILVTHEHGDHAGGLKRHPQLAVLGARVRMTAEQLADPMLRQVEGADVPAIREIQPLHFARHHAVAPGIVLIKAPGHSAGSQLIYVQLVGGEELLFIGDIGRTRDNVEIPRGRPRLIADYVLREDRDAVLHQLRAIHELTRTEDVAVVMSHDADGLQAHIDAGRILAGFE